MLSEPGGPPGAVTGSTSGRRTRTFTPAATPTETANRQRPVITAEGVVLSLHPAGIASRIAAALIDLTALYALFNALSAALGLVSATLGSTAFAIGAAIVAGVVTLAYPIAQETLWNGKTLGKAAVGLRVVSQRGGPIGFRQAAVRGALLLVDATILMIPWTLAMVLSSRRRRLGDLAAGTLVVKERRPGGAHLRPIAFDPPPPLWEYRDRLDVTALDDAGYRLVRNLLLRGPQLDAAVRRALTERCASSLAARLSATPPVWPTGTPWAGAPLSAEHFLLCVASAYQRRHRPSGAPDAGPPAAAGRWAAAR